MNSWLFCQWGKDIVFVFERAVLHPGLDDQKWMMIEMDDDQNGWGPKWKTAKMVDDQNGR